MTTQPASSPAAVVQLAGKSDDLDSLGENITHCRACPRLVEWRERVAAEKRKSFAHQKYWGRPVPGFGDDHPAVLIVGLAPAAHGGNRTGRVFTGDRSGDWLFASLCRVGLANQPEAVSIDDGLTLRRTRILAAVRCAPPANKPTTLERDVCSVWFDKELELIRPHLRVVLSLGAFAWGATLSALERAGGQLPSPRPRFGHGAQTNVDGLTVLGCFHPSQQNTFTGKLTEGMLDEVLRAAAAHAGL
ncbi:MAG: uracil-DNA glycosylase [Candidatus Nanopelagicales bacterium]